jgi:hypothetical protein
MVFAQNLDGELVVAMLTPRTCAAETPELDVGMCLRAVNGVSVVDLGGNAGALHRVNELWDAESAVSLKLSDPPPVPEPAARRRQRQKPTPNAAVVQFLESVGCTDRLDALSAFGVQGMDDLPFLEAEDFVDLQFTSVQQQAMVKALAELAEAAPAAAAVAVPAPAAPGPEQQLEPEPEPDVELPSVPQSKLNIYISPFLDAAASDAEAQRIRSRLSSVRQHPASPAQSLAHAAAVCLCPVSEQLQLIDLDSIRIAPGLWGRGAASARREVSCGRWATGAELGGGDRPEPQNNGCKICPAAALRLGAFF